MQGQAATQKRAPRRRTPVEDVVRVQYDALRRKLAHVRCDVCIARVAVEGHVIKAKVILQNHDQMWWLRGQRGTEAGGHAYRKQEEDGERGG